MNFIKNLFRKRLSQKEQIRLKFRDAFDNCVKSKIVRSAMTGDSFSDGMLVYAALVNTYDAMKNNEQMQLLSAMCILKDGYDPCVLLDEELSRALKKYCGMDNGSDDVYK